MHRAIKKKWFPVIAVGLIGFTPIVILVRKEEAANKVTELLNLDEKYLVEQNYEQVIPAIQGRDIDSS